MRKGGGGCNLRFCNINSFFLTGGCIWQEHVHTCYWSQCAQLVFHLCYWRSFRHKGNWMELTLLVFLLELNCWQKQECGADRHTEQPFAAALKRWELYQSPSAQGSGLLSEGACRLGTQQNEAEWRQVAELDDNENTCDKGVMDVGAGWKHSWIISRRRCTAPKDPVWLHGDRQRF